MNRTPTAEPARANVDRGRSGRKAPASDPPAAPFRLDDGAGAGPSSPGSTAHAGRVGMSGRRNPSRLGSVDAGIVLAFTASVAAGIVIWALALGYFRY
jgi:hypothetical protein